jgi:NAD(P)-dependent dehydrogenase (short-subunit alcohol dehydrogenase family)
MNQKVLVTAGAAGIGPEIAKSFAAAKGARFFFAFLRSLNQYSSKQN